MRVKTKNMAESPNAGSNVNVVLRKMVMGVSSMISRSAPVIRKKFAEVVIDMSDDFFALFRGSDGKYEFVVGTMRVREYNMLVRILNRMDRIAKIEGNTPPQIRNTYFRGVRRPCGSRYAPPYLLRKLNLTQQNVADFKVCTSLLMSYGMRSWAARTLWMTSVRPEDRHVGAAMFAADPRWKWGTQDDALATLSTFDALDIETRRNVLRTREVAHYVRSHTMGCGIAALNVTYFMAPEHALLDHHEAVSELLPALYEKNPTVLSRFVVASGPPPMNFSSKLHVLNFCDDVARYASFPVWCSMHLPRFDPAGFTVPLTTVLELMRNQVLSPMSSWLQNFGEHAQDALSKEDEFWGRSLVIRGNDDVSKEDIINALNLFVPDATCIPRIVTFMRPFFPQACDVKPSLLPHEPLLIERREIHYLLENRPSIVPTIALFDIIKCHVVRPSLNLEGLESSVAWCCFPYVRHSEIYALAVKMHDHLVDVHQHVLADVWSDTVIAHIVRAEEIAMSSFAT